MLVLATAYLPNISAVLMVSFRNKTEMNALPGKKNRIYLVEYTALY